ncbi:hypothetical protein [Rubinisphaera margarita]|uniref:hypothetical protein n=1 Tax=Rubinisphaera margarita TaxID=2909586 RepID=UPI001EE97988|nr:hypothetical protein [Rubinisphaera margarita]MCG6156449.1 hypothetical protein [Rubinisphaera margarita]
MNTKVSSSQYGNVSTGSSSNQAEGLRPAEDIVNYLKEYAREKPEAAALWCFGIGFFVGWKIKPW